jgi:hypothetical protein
MFEKIVPWSGKMTGHLRIAIHLDARDIAVQRVRRMKPDDGSSGLVLNCIAAGDCPIFKALIRPRRVDFRPA